MFLLFHRRKKGTSGPNKCTVERSVVALGTSCSANEPSVLNKADPDNTLRFRPYSKEETNPLELTRVGPAIRSVRFRTRLSRLISSSNFSASDAAAKRLGLKVFGKIQNSATATMISEKSLDKRNGHDDAGWLSGNSQVKHPKQVNVRMPTAGLQRCHTLFFGEYAFKVCTTYTELPQYRQSKCLYKSRAGK